MVLGLGFHNAFGSHDLGSFGLTRLRHFHRLYEGLTDVPDNFTPWRLCFCIKPELVEQLAVADAYPGGAGDEPVLGGRPIPRMEEQLVPSRVPCRPPVQGAGVGLRELRHLEGQQRPCVAVQIGRPDAYDGQRQVAAQDRVELGDATRPRIQVVPCDTVDHFWRTTHSSRLTFPLSAAGLDAFTQPIAIEAGPEALLH